MDMPDKNAQEPFRPSSEFEPTRFFDSFLSVTAALVMRPRRFFQGLPRSADISRALIFLVVCVFLSALLMANVKGGGVQLFVLLFASNVISAFVGSYILHKLVGRVFGVAAPFACTFRVIAYASLMDIVSWVPGVGILAYVYGLYLTFLGLQEVHRLNPRQAATAVLLIVVLVTVLLVLALMLAAGNIDQLQQNMQALDPQAGMPS